MRLQDQVVRATQRALDDVCRAALALPEDRRDWSPGGDARSALSQMREIALQAEWFVPLIRDQVTPSFRDHALREARRLIESYTTIDECIQAARQGLADLLGAISALRDEDLEVEVDVPFGGGTRMTMADIVQLPAWNMIYHLGQINYLQLMLGDKEMH